MVTHRRNLFLLLLLPLSLVAACDKVPLLAPTGSVITLFPATTTVSLNSEVTITATVIENGSAPAGSGTGTGSTSRSGAGTPVQNGTVVSFTTTIGRIEPAEARTHNGQVTVKLITTGVSGVATITAYSGGTSAQLTNLKIGTAAAKTVTVATTPQSLGSSGGTSTIVATVIDEGGNPLSGIPVTFTTDKGTVSPTTVNTDPSGAATATLTTTSTAKVTATAGTITSTAATVNVNQRGLSGFSASPSSTTAGTPVTFTVTPTTGANLANVRVNFGDGSSRDLGAISSATTVAHSYSASGTYTATATSTDASGDAGSLSTDVIVGSLQVTLSASPASPTVNSPVTFTVSGLGSATIDHFTWTWDDGTPQQTTTSPQNGHVFTSKGLKNVTVEVFGVSGGRLGKATITVDVN